MMIFGTVISFYFSSGVNWLPFANDDDDYYFVFYYVFHYVFILLFILFFVLLLFLRYIFAFCRRVEERIKIHDSLFLNCYC